MDNQPLMPGSSGLFSSPPSSGNNRSPIMFMLIVVLGLGTIGFGAATVLFSGKAATANKTLESHAATAAAKARLDQKKLDDEANTKLNESPFRSYTAPEEFGSFVVTFPKNWSSRVDQETSGTQVSLDMNPDFLRKINGTDTPVAAKVQLMERTKDQFLNQYTSLVKKGTMKQANVKISGLPAYDLTGTFSDHKTVRQVVVPIRDKVLVYSTENSTYATEFNEILAQAKIIP
jgi:hypothetical protein